jgi:predicted flap endonuclease-1-like 5' DNA nuclease
MTLNNILQVFKIQAVTPTTVTVPKTLNPTYRANATKRLPLENLPGIGRHTPKALAKYGIRTIHQFAQFTENEVESLLGKSGLKLLFTAKNICQKAI